MINIVHRFFANARQRCHSPGRRSVARPLVLAAALTFKPAATDAASPTGLDMHRIAGSHTIGAAERVVGCDSRIDCPGRRPPGPPDRDARPFEGTLGRPCAYRWRFTPEGTRRVRVCF